ncbi:Signal peptidase I [Penicillium brevicompactum]|uniref:Signal peptidase complex catalytic subunit SEC11 n=1 Tax=Penicillium brevicompactum TaxID=5074 RepID=A0A9W9UF21_PENBR|nr:Signal peptidase I [Penicillium brevicompactum]
MPQNWHSPRGTLTLLLWSLLLITFPFMAWKALCVFTGSSHPIMVVISESMAPAFTRGDLIFLWNRQSWVRAGEIPVCWFPGRPLPMVHRAIKSCGIGAYLRLHRRQFTLTKGDNNDGDDAPLYPPGQLMVGREEVVGLVKGYLPYVGWLSIGLQESPLVTGALVGGLLLLAAS